MKSKKSNFNNKSNNEKTSDLALLNIEAAINLIPYAGGFLATYFGEIRSKRVDERMKEYFQYFSERLREINENKLDLNYLKSEEFAEFFMQGAEQASKSTTKKRIKRFANILINNALKGAEARSRTQSIMSFVDRISDLDAFVLLCYGNPTQPSFRAKSRDEAFLLVKNLIEFIGIGCPLKEEVIESIVYMDNLGITWVNEKLTDETTEKGSDMLLKEFSSFRTPLGNAVAAMIAPPDFYLSQISDKSNNKWPDDYVSNKYCGKGNL